jgi:UDP-N-acetylmuramyl pentapeptide phosphotransferase/UDP-N-acetylglucosamine-1-phosphate transferase
MIAVGWQLSPDQRVMAWLLLLERVLLGVAWIWFINLFNFMDGIDGLAGSEAISVIARQSCWQAGQTILFLWRFSSPLQWLPICIGIGPQRG